MCARSLQFLLVSGLVACTGGSSDDRIDGSVADARTDARVDPVLDGAPAPDGTLESDAALTPDAAIVVDAAMTPDAPTITCGMAATGNWRGIANIWHNGSGGGDYIEADAEWMLASTTGCVDTFRPTGTVRYGFDHSGGSDEHQSPLSPSDGMLVIDRTNAIASYTIVGSTAAAGGAWADQRGTFDGRAFGGYIPDNGGAISYDWSIIRVDATFPPSGCSEPATEQWQSSFANPDRHSHATATWTRTSTEGCVDHFSPSGTAYSEPSGTTFDATLTYNPDHGAIDPNQPVLIIDRSVAPPKFQVLYGSTSWPAQLVYTYPDGHVETQDGSGISIWSDAFQGVYDGNHFAASIADNTGWTFSR